MSKTSQAIAVFFLFALAMLLAACQPEAVTDIPPVPQTAQTLAPTAAPSATVPATATVPVQSNANENANANDNENANANENANENANANENGEDYGDDDYGAPSANTPVETAAPVTGAISDEVKLRFQNAGDLGQILVDERGMTLYRFTNDAPGVSNCSGQCAVNWPPLLVAFGGKVEIDEMDEEGLISTITRADGAAQVTYKGQPLYYWINDKQPGDTTGQNVNGVWFVVNP